MKRYTTIAIIIAICSLTGCTFDTDIDADVYDNGTMHSDGDPCDGISALLEGETDPETIEQLERAYTICRDRNPDDPDRPDDPTCEDGTNDPSCPPPDDPRCDADNPDGSECPPPDEPICNEDDPDGANCPPPDDCEIVEVQTADGEIIEEERCPPVDPGDDLSCDPLYDDANGPTDTDVQAWYQRCLDLGYGAQTCEQRLNDCLDRTDPGPDPTCQQAYDALEEAGVDPASFTGDEFLSICRQTMADDALCEDLAHACFPVDPNDPGDPTDPNVECDQIRQFLSDQGYDLPLSDDQAQVLYEECVNSMNDAEHCEQLLVCATR